MNAELFDTLPFYGRAIKSHALARNDIGDVAEIFACAALRMDRQRIDGRKEVCEDARWKGFPVEIKSVGQNNRGLLYVWRAEKDIRVHGPNLLYVFVRHDCRNTVANSAEIVQHFADHPPRLIVATLGTILEALKNHSVTPRKFTLFKEKPGEPVNHRIGYNRPGYIDGGWQFSLGIIPSAIEREIMAEWKGQRLRIAAAFTTEADAVYRSRKRKTK